nr:MAG TPA: hypothetical protein [Caudoviricetes sp.]
MHLYRVICTFSIIFQLFKLYEVFLWVTQTNHSSSRA